MTTKVLEVFPKSKKVDIIVPCWNNLDYSKMCIESILNRTDYNRSPYRLILIDNGSKDGTGAYFLSVQHQYPDRVVIISNEQNTGWVGACNQGALESFKYDDTGYTLFLNNDVLITQDNWLSGLIDPIHDRPDLAASGPVSNAVAGRQNTIYNSKATAEEVPYIIGFCMMMKKPWVEFLVKQDGWFMDPIFNPGGCDELDVCLRLSEVGMRFYVNRKVYLHHFLSRSLSKVTDNLFDFHADKMALLTKKHGEVKVNAMLERVLERVLIGIPTVGNINHKFLLTIVTLVKPQGVVIDTCARSLPDIARNHLAEEAMAHGCDYVFMLDDDMIFDDENLLMKLLAHMKAKPEMDMVSCMAFMRHAPYLPCSFKESGDPPLYSVVDSWQKGLIEVDATTSSCALIRTSLFRRMKEAMGHDRYYDFIHVGKHRMGEDLGFCYQAKKFANARIFVDSDLQVHHIGDPILVNRHVFETYNQSRPFMEKLKFA